jgi:predicted  nucleic acid-binding Zn-ribbon protein
MSLAKRVFELQQVEQSIQAKRNRLEEINHGLNHNETYEQAKAALDAARDEQRAQEKQYKDLDAEAEELRVAIQHINEKLYSGKIKNPKELVGYEQEAGMFKGTLGGKDDVLLDLMEKIDSDKVKIRKLDEVCKAAEGDWQSQKVTLTQQADQINEELAALQKKYDEIFAAVDKATLSTYEVIRGRKGQAVVRVEQGRCLGCRVALAISELQRVRGNDIVTCSNCGRILYLS